MILEAKYIGPFKRVYVPGFEDKKVERGELVKLRIPDGVVLPACWKITKGQEAYGAALKVAEQKRADEAKAREEARVKRLAKMEEDKKKAGIDPMSVYKAAGEVDHTVETAKQGKKPAGEKGGAK